MVRLKNIKLYSNCSEWSERLEEEEMLYSNCSEWTEKLEVSKDELKIISKMLRDQTELLKLLDLNEGDHLDMDDRYNVLSRFIEDGNSLDGFIEEGSHEIYNAIREHIKELRK